MRHKKIYHVHLNVPHLGKKDYFFASKNSICAQLGKDVIGVGKDYLSNTHIDEGCPFSNTKCVISAERVL